jgi:16S rRNA (cytidine1402-2'-O)-methyltransferase
VSDAGTPLLSDPGFELVRRVAQEGIQVVSVPGPSAITAALSIAGLPTERFSFEGFLPARLAERRSRIAELAPEARTLVFFEAPHRITESLDDLVAGFGGGRRAAVARELTKVFETVYRGTLDELAEQARGDANFSRGEITMVVEGAPRAVAGDAPRIQLDSTLRVLLTELSPSKAAALAARLTGAKRNDAYARALELGKAERDPPA